MLRFSPGGKRLFARQHCSGRSRRSRPVYRPALEALEVRLLPTIYPVTSVADSGPGTLRQAILDSNGNPGPNMIQFQIPGTGVQTIRPTSQLPAIITPVQIDGTTQTGYTGSPLIELDGSLAGANVNGLVVTGGSTTIEALVINRFSGDGVILSGGSGNVIESNYIGTDATGTIARGNGALGILVYNSSKANRIGTNGDGVNDIAERNVISGNNFSGVQILDPGTDQNVVAGNFIGTDVTGTAKLTNGNLGVWIGNGAQHNRIGINAGDVDAIAERNVISGNNFQGVGIFDPGTNSNVVAGNYIGTDVTGTKALGNGNNGIWVNGGPQSNDIRANVISANTYSGVNVNGVGTNQNVLTGNFIGTDVTGTKALGNGNYGVSITGGAKSNRIGTDGNAGGRNLISGNAFSGVLIVDPGTDQNVVAGNFIGTDITGTVKLTNGNLGVWLGNSAQNNRVGVHAGDANAAAERNIISGNNFQGVGIFDAGTNHNVVAGNFIGTDVTGTKALGNGNNGIWVNGGPQANDIRANVISANAFSGVNIGGVGTNQNVVAGNYIGTDVTGTQVLGNGNYGIWISGGPQASHIQANVVGGNAYSGVEISGSGTKQNVLTGNFVGTDRTGTLSLSNGTYGISISTAAQANVVGGAPAQGNVIAFNKLAGVAVADANTTGNSIRANAIYANGGLGIDLGGDGVTVNHAGGSTTGPNLWQNYPVLQTATPGNPTVASGTLNAAPNTTYVLDFYASSAPDITFYGQGQRYLDSASVTTDASGNATFTVVLAAATDPGNWLSATATDPAGNTSEFSGARQLPYQGLGLNTTTWVPIGPSPIADSPLFNGAVVAGRVSVAAPDPTNPNIMYIGADGGGVWKTTDWLDPSPAWTPLTDSQPSLSFNNISYQALVDYPGNPMILYAAMSGPGGGILKSTDAGNSWTELANGLFNQVYFGSLVVSPTDSNLLYATVWGGTIAGGVYRSTDGGQNWTNLTVSIHNGGASDLVMDPTNPSVLYAGLVNGGSTNGLYRTSDGGATWQRLSNGLPTGGAVGASIRLALAPSDPQTVYATVFNAATGNPQRYRTANGGTSWSSLTPLPGQEETRYWHMLLSVDPTDPQVVYANGAGPVYRSTNGGSTWTQIYAEDPIGGFFDANGHFVLVGDRGIYSWAGPGTAFANKQGDLQVSELYTLTLDPTNPNVAYGIAQDHFRGLKYNGYPVWNYLGGADEVGKILVNPDNPNRVYTYDPLNTASFIQRSDDGGATWINSGSGIPTNLAGFDLAYSAQKAFVIDPTNSHRLLVGTRQVYQTTNDAGSWTAISPELSPGQYITALAIAPSAPSTIYAATADGRVFVTTDGGTTWQERDTGLPRDAFDRIVDFEIDPLDPNHVVIVPGTFPTNVFGSSHVWTTTNGGSSWTDIRGNLPANDWTNGLAVDWRVGPPVLYVGTARGVFVSTNNGTTWSPYGQALPNAAVTDLQFLPQFNLLAAATYGRGVFEILVPGPSGASSGATPGSAVAMLPVDVVALAQPAQAEESTGPAALGRSLPSVSDDAFANLAVGDHCWSAAKPNHAHRRGTRLSSTARTEGITKLEKELGIDSVLDRTRNQAT